jgi:threonine/homoserine/homoserine lactone efflux protein
MRPLPTIFCTGLFISFMGTLPLGTLNVLAAQMAVNEGISPALWFSLGALLVEMIYVRLSLVAMDWIRRRKKWMRILEGVTVVIIFLLALGSFRAAAHPGHSSGVVIGAVSVSPVPRLLTGMLLSAINPLQIPFWFGWSMLLFQRNILQPRRDHFNMYIMGIGLGTFAGNAVFIFGGRLFVKTLAMHPSLVNGVIGAIFIVTASIQLIKLLRPSSIGPGRPD